MSVITPEILESLRVRRASGEKVKTLAAELGFTPWQKLEKLLRRGLPSPEPITFNPPEPAAGVTLPSEAFTRIYYPRTVAELLGQPEARALLAGFVRDPYPVAFLFHGDTGVGKTSGARALAVGLGCELDECGLGGVRTIASGEQTADTVRAAINQLHYTTLRGSGWKVLIVNEADRMHPAAEMIWLDALETLPPKAVIIFTTNHAEKLSDRFRDRCRSVEFISNAAALHADARAFLAQIWHDCTGQLIPRDVAERLIESATTAGALSYRRLVQLAENEVRMLSVSSAIAEGGAA